MSPSQVPNVWFLVPHQEAQRAISWFCASGQCFADASSQAEQDSNCTEEQGVMLTEVKANCDFCFGNHRFLLALLLPCKYCFFLH